MTTINLPFPPLVIFWILMALLAFAGWAVFTAMMGVQEKARWETILVFWTGRVLLIALSVSVLLLTSYGLLALSVWVLK